MLLHAGAGLHGHEFSTPAHDQHQHGQHHHHNPPTGPFPFLRSALRPLSELADPIYQEFSRRSFTDPTISSTSSATESTTTHARTRPVSEIVSKKDLSVRFQEPDMDLSSPTASIPPSDDDDSLAGSDFTVATSLTRASTSGPRRRRTTKRRSTRYAMAHPAPQLLTKQRALVQIRPRLLLQLQKLGERRPTPAFDVVPSSIITGSLIIPKLTARFPRLFGKKPHLGQDDLLVLRSEDYSEQCENVSSGQATFDNRELLAVISPLPDAGDDCSEIIMEDGSAWSTSGMANGAYEFRSTDILGRTTVARWVKRPITNVKAKMTQGAIDTSPLSTPPPQEYKWTFSIINPHTRRHPIMGVITGHELEIYDTYNTLSASSGRFPPTKPFNLSGHGQEPASPTSTISNEERLTEFVLERYKKLMMATASWISLRSEGWPASLNPKMRRTLPSCRIAHSSSQSSNREQRRRTFPFHDKSPSPNLMDDAAAVRSPSEKDVTPGAASPPAAIPRRSTSTGAAFMRSRGVFMEPTEGSYFPEKEQLVTDRSAHPKVVSRANHVPEEKTHTCRIKVLRLTRRLFHRKEYQTA